MYAKFVKEYLDYKRRVPRVIPILIFLLTLITASKGQVRLPRLISNGMVLQRHADVRLWGWSSANEEITVSFIDSIYTARSDDKGEWAIQLSGLEAGGPYSMQIRGRNTIVVDDIFIGDVWICSGQSNMKLSMEWVRTLYETEIENSENSYIRYFEVPEKYDFNTPLKDITQGEWFSAGPLNTPKFSAVSYFFALELYKKYGVPVGLINASLGGSPIEAWISEDVLKSFPGYYEELQRFKDSSLIKQIESKDKIRIDSWYAKLGEDDEGYKNASRPWHDPGLNITDWKVMKVPGYWAGDTAGNINGAVWFRKDINLPAAMIGKPAKLALGRIVDADSVFVNGVFVGTTSYQWSPRRYDIPQGLLKEGENTIVVRVISNTGKGGFVEDKSYELIAGGQSIDLKGDWKYQLGARMEPLENRTSVAMKPAGLYNAMISPLINYAAKGIIWYQGESNTGSPEEYAALFQALINNWREKWKRGSLPFIYVQLPNYLRLCQEPSESNWALLREAQQAALTMPKTGMAVTIDIGEWNDVHPLNKKDVGHRLALWAQKLAYNDSDVVYSGPLFRSVKIRNNKAVLTFSNTGSGLAVGGGGALNYFAIAGADRRFVWAEARIEHDRVLVWSDEVQNPVAVRYAWADNPEGANLFNKEGLPASPFRTDKWDY
jgi:sialate O-acetylesterase